MKTVTSNLKSSLVQYLTAVIGGQIAVADETTSEKISLPVLAVDVPSSEPHSARLAHVLRCQVSITLRCHSGDNNRMDEWAAMIESALNCQQTIRTAITNDIVVDYWNYYGATQSWDESVIETSFSAECMVRQI